MEVEGEDDDEELGELCSEILENWNSPIYSEFHTFHQNPFSLHHYQPINTTYDYVQRVNNKQDKGYPIVSDLPQPSSLHDSQHNRKILSNVETKISMTTHKYGNRKNGFVSGHKDNRILKALKPTNYEKGYKHEEASEKCIRNTSMDRPIIPVLIADTFFDKLLGHYVDGFDIAALNKVKEAKACENEAQPSTVIANNGKRKQKLNYGQCNFPMVNMPASSTAPPILIRDYFHRGFAPKLRYALPPNKTIFDINIDDFGEKLWRNPGVDMSDYFNYGLDEKHWKDYFKLMQAQIQVQRRKRRKTATDESRQALKTHIHWP